MPLFISTSLKLSFKRNNGCPVRGLNAPDCGGKTLMERTASPVALQLVGMPVPEEFVEAMFAAMEALDAGIWLPPFRTPASPDYPTEASPFLLCPVFGWVFDTTITVSRLVFAGIFDRHPRLKLMSNIAQRQHVRKETVRAWGRVGTGPQAKSNSRRAILIFSKLKSQSEGTKCGTDGSSRVYS